jgi:hypothetical protein
VLVAARRATVERAEAAPPLAPNGGDQLMYIGTYAGTIQVFDEATEAKIADIKLQTGIPRALTLSQSRTKFYVMDSTNEKMEIVDIPTRTTLSTFTLSEGNKKVRIRGFQVDPLERFLILLTRSATKQIDRYEIGDIAMQFYDLAQKKITRTIPWPRGEEREFVNIRFSPDGKLLYFLRRRCVDPGDDQLHRGRHLAAEPADRARASAASTSDRSTTSTRIRVLHRPVHDPGPDSEPPHHEYRARQSRREDDRSDPDWSGGGVSFAMSSDRKRAYGLVQGGGQTPAAADWPFRVLGLRCRAAEAAQPHAVRRPSRAWPCGCRPTASCSTCTRPARRSTSTTPRRTRSCAPSR